MDCEIPEHHELDLAYTSVNGSSGVAVDRKSASIGSQTDTLHAERHRAGDDRR